jgi:hypothetical protein
MKQTFVDGTVDPQKMMMAFASLMKDYMEGEHITKATGAPVGPYVHGPGGLFGVRGLERDVISTHTQIKGVLADQIPIRPSNDMQPLFPYITGFLRSDQQEKNLVCDDPAQASNFKTCIQTTVFGRKEFKTRTAEINRIGQRLNRGEFLDLNLLNGPLAEQMGGLMQSFIGLDNQQSILAGREMAARMVEVGVAFQRWLCPAVYTGNPANNSTGGGYKEFPGLQLLISKSKVDALTGQACPSLYSDVASFGYRQVNDTADPDIVRTITSMLRVLKRKSVLQDLDPVDWRLVMREPLFYELTRYWPCQYNTDACSFPILALNNANAQLYVDSAQNIAMRDRMRAGHFLLVDGVEVPVIVDDTILENTHNDNAAIPISGFSSSIYFIPFTARGGQIQTIFWEYYDYRTGTMPAVTDARMGTFFWSDEGTFLWGIRPPNNWCVDMIAKMEPRLILLTPQLAGVLQNVVYIPLQHTDDPLPSQNYFVNGGVTTGRPAPSPYSEWNLGGPGFYN